MRQGWTSMVVGIGALAVALTLPGGVGAAGAHRVARQTGVQITLVVSGHGTVALPRGGQLACRRTPACSRRLLIPRGTRVILKVRPVAPWTFARWTGLCVGVSPACAFVARTRGTIRATLTRPGEYLFHGPLAR